MSTNPTTEATEALTECSICEGLFADDEMAEPRCTFGGTRYEPAEYEPVCAGCADADRIGYESFWERIAEDRALGF